MKKKFYQIWESGNASDRARSEANTLDLTKEQRLLFEQDVVVHCKSLFRYLCKLSKDCDLSHDLMQETMIVAQRYYALGQVKQKDKVLFWLQKIGRNILISHFRKQVRRNAMLDVHRVRICDNLGWLLPDVRDKDSLFMENLFGEKETQEALRRAKVLQNLEILLQTGFDGLSLTGEEKALLHERHIQQKAFKELASSLGKPLSTVMSRYYALMKRVQRELCAWESEGFLDKRLTKNEMLQISKIRDNREKQARRPWKK